MSIAETPPQLQVDSFLKSNITWENNNSLAHTEVDDFLHISGPDKKMWIIIIASASALVLIILLIISVVCILRCRRSKHKIIETEVPMGEDFTSSLIDIPLNRDDPEMLKSGDITKNTTVMSTIVTNTKLTSHKFVHKPSKRTD